MKKDIFKIVPLFIPCLIAIILGCVFLFSDIYDGPTKTISGDISFFNKGSHHRYYSTPMSIEIEGDKYIISGGVRWATDFSDLQGALSIGKTVTIEFYEETNMRYVVGIEGENNFIVTKNDYIEGQYQQNQVKSIIFFFFSYTYFLIIIIILLSMSNKFNYRYNTGFINKVYIRKKKLILNIIISILMMVGSLCVCLISKWLYIPMITLSLVYLFIMVLQSDKIYFGSGGFLLSVCGKKKHYGWNAIKEIIEVKRKKTKIVILNFKENYKYNDDSIINYVLLAKKRKNKCIYVLYLKKDMIKSFDALYKKYYKKSLIK